MWLKWYSVSCVPLQALELHLTPAMLRKAASSHPGWQRLLSLTHAVKDSGRSDNEQPKWSWIWPETCNTPEGICFVLFYLFRYKWKYNKCCRSPWVHPSSSLGVLFEPWLTMKSCCKSNLLLMKTSSLSARFTVPVCMLENWTGVENI